MTEPSESRSDASKEISPSQSLSPSPPSLDQDQDQDHSIEAMLTPQLSREVSHVLARRTTSVKTSDPRFEIDWEPDDPANPLNWKTWYKGLVTFTLSWSTLVVVLYSTSYTSGIYQIQEEFNIASEPVATLGVTTYLLGISCGVLLAAPLSEMYGRRIIFLTSMILFIILVIPTGIGSSLEEVVIARFFGALFAATLIANTPGALGDITNDKYRALVFSIWSIGPMNGPLWGPLMGGFTTQYLGWRFANWIVMVLGGLALVLLACMHETYAPTLLRRKAHKKRVETGDSRWWCRYDERDPLWNLLKVNLSRPLVMAATEPICIFWNVYIGVVYAILYLCFVAYPIVFTQIRGWSISFTGLSFLGNGVGTLIVIALEPVFRRLIQSHKPDPDTGKPSLDSMMSVVCIGALASPLGELWFAWTSLPPIHWIWPVLAGVLFGFGNVIIFIYGSTYLVGSYGRYGASASAGNTLVRSVMGAALPLAGPAMYSNLGANWASSICGFLLVLIAPVPFVFYKYGGEFRKRSTLITQMRADLERLEGKKNRKRVTGSNDDVEKGVELDREGSGEQSSTDPDVSNGKSLNELEKEVGKIG